MGVKIIFSISFAENTFPNVLKKKRTPIIQQEIDESVGEIGVFKIPDLDTITSRKYVFKISESNSNTSMEVQLVSWPPQTIVYGIAPNMISK
jgi:hypothetical protein